MKKVYTVYKIFYRGLDGDEFLVYVGRTKQTLRCRLRAHFTMSGNPMTKMLSVGCVSRILYAELETEAERI
jgi:hypothetical protein